MKKKLTEADRIAFTVEWSDENDGFLACAPELPGCICVMDTQDAAIKEIRMLIGEFLENRRRRELKKLRQLVAA